MRLKSLSLCFELFAPRGWISFICLLVVKCWLTLGPSLCGSSGMFILSSWTVGLLFFYVNKLFFYVNYLLTLALTSVKCFQISWHNATRKYISIDMYFTSQYVHSFWNLLNQHSSVSMVITPVDESSACSLCRIHISFISNSISLSLRFSKIVAT